MRQHSLAGFGGSPRLGIDLGQSCGHHVRPQLPVLCVQVLSHRVYLHAGGEYAQSRVYLDGGAAALMPQVMVPLELEIWQRFSLGEGLGSSVDVVCSWCWMLAPPRPDPVLVSHSTLSSWSLRRTWNILEMAKQPLCFH